MSEREILHCADAAAWERWLAEHHADSPGVRLAIAKKGSGVASVGYADAVEVALCWGWIDGRRDRLDEVHFLQGFSPRRPRSIWSQVNRDKVAALTAEGRMQPAGQAEVDRAKADGRWDAAYASQRTSAVPDDLQAALDADPAAAAFFATLNSQNRYAILFRTGSVKKAETRARKIAEYVAMLARGETIYPQGTPAADG
ncbi:MAG: hypothetical protein JWL64_1135 [Frankiales bacterium]|nr:hypothetical protein [Frankiales bacterium]